MYDVRVLPKRHTICNFDLRNKLPVGLYGFIRHHNRIRAMSWCRSHHLAIPALENTCVHHVVRAGYYPYPTKKTRGTILFANEKSTDEGPEADPERPPAGRRSAPGLHVRTAVPALDFHSHVASKRCVRQNSNDATSEDLGHTVAILRRLRGVGGQIQLSLGHVGQWPGSLPGHRCPRSNSPTGKGRYGLHSMQVRFNFFPKRTPLGADRGEVRVFAPPARFFL